MTGYRLRPAARRDLSSIWDFSEERWDVQQAETYVREINAALLRIAADPSRGRLREDILPGYRSWAVGSHIVFYLVEPNFVDVIRILHQRMDPGRHL